MIESFITVLILGFLAGFFFSIPVAGPISIIITSNALKARRRFCNRTAIGASIVEFFYVFLAVFGIAMLYSAYKNFIPYLLISGSLFLIYVGYKIIQTKLKLDDFEVKTTVNKIKDEGGLRTGLILNFTNPSLFIGWLTSSFLIFSFASSIGLNTGGLDLIVKENVHVIESISEKTISDVPMQQNNNDKIAEENSTKSSKYKIFLSLIYAFAVSLGSFVWFYNYVKFIIHYREKLKLNIVNGLIKGLGIVLMGIAVYLIYQGVSMIA